MDNLDQSTFLWVVYDFPRGDDGMPIGEYKTVTAIFSDEMPPIDYGENFSFGVYRVRDGVLLRWTKDFFHCIKHEVEIDSLKHLIAYHLNESDKVSLIYDWWDYAFHQSLDNDNPASDFRIEFIVEKPSLVCYYHCMQKGSPCLKVFRCH